ncbi:MAG: 3-phosphoshikimate 1-carboxyvinyltransferase [Candidatus Omnitrophica bacterium]|nr:3-phosphoshikimate 1-carboxyvinyltransferase [Candidatus Omnitrophota bacterium]
MSNITLRAKKLQGAITAPADKSISHRAIIISSLAQGQTCIKNLSSCEDCLRTIGAFKNMGVSITNLKDVGCVQGKGLNGLEKPPKGELYLGNSGTSMRLISGVLAAQDFSCRLLGDASLSRRPMKRVTQPLSLMGAKIQGTGDAQLAPLTVEGQVLHAIYYNTPVPSAQVKSAILLAGLYAEGKTQVREPSKSRDHTERMLKAFGADISVEDLLISVRGKANLISSKDVHVPGDISAASFFLIGACICAGSQVSVQSVGLNPTRTGFLKILQKMGADISWSYQDNRMSSDDYDDEARGEINAKYSQLQAVNITPEQIASVIDELPILMVAATQAEGKTIIQGAGELRVKESDRINTMVTNLSRMGADISATDNDVIIRGPSKLKGAVVDSFNDHRTAMSMAIASLLAAGQTTIQDIDCVSISFPGFFEALSRLSK